MPTFAADARPQDFRPITAPVPDLWAGDSSRFWARTALGRPIDAQRTAALADVNQPVEMPAGTAWAGSVYGQPVQQASGSQRFDCLDLTQSWWPFWTWQQRAVVSMPDPGPLRLEADPTPSFDRHWRCIESGGRWLWEVFHLQPGGFPFATVQCSAWARWDLSRPWNQQGVRGVVAAGFPHVPLVITSEDLGMAGLRHGCFLGVKNYSPGRTGPAIGSDGTDARSPLRAGEWLRLRTDVANRISLNGNPMATALVQGLALYGCYVGDKTGGPAVLTGTHDVRLAAVGPLGLKLTDFEVVGQ